MSTKNDSIETELVVFNLNYYYYFLLHKVAVERENMKCDKEDVDDNVPSSFAKNQKFVEDNSLIASYFHKSRLRGRKYVDLNANNEIKI